MTGPGDGFVLGVDLGTSHTVAMLRHPDGRTRPLLFDGRPLLPSATYLDTTGRLHMGADAQRLGYAEPDRYEPNPKRHVDAPTVQLGGTPVPVVDLFAGLLGAVAREAVAVTGLLPPAVLTCPASWGARRREVLLRSAAQAGWPADTRLVPEPVAAARYFTDVLRRPVPVGSSLAVLDFGGGTLDVAVVRHDGRDSFVVTTSGSLDDLGGLDVDAALVDRLGTVLAGAEPQAWGALSDPVTLAQWRARRQFRDDVRGAKEMLSRTTLAPVPVPGVEHALHLDRDELEAAVTPLVRRGAAEAAAVIRAAGLAPGDLAGLFLVGGSSRMPLVARLLHSELGIAPTVLEQPELPVAEGAVVAGPHGTGPGVSGGGPVEEGVPPIGAAPTGAAPAGAAPTLAAPAGAGAVAGAGDAGVDGTPVRYAEPVDPWAIGEAAAFGAGTGSAAFGGGTGHGAFGGGPGAGPGTAGYPPGSPAGYPPGSPAWLASAEERAARPAYRRKGFRIVAAATAVVLAAGATLAVILWPGYRALDFRPLGEPARFAPAVAPRGSFADTETIGDRAYYATTDTDDTLGIVAVDTGRARTVWTSAPLASPAGWDSLVALPTAVAAISTNDSATGRRLLVVAGADDGRERWRRDLGTDDGVLFVADVAVLVDRTANRVVGLDLGTGRQRWARDSPRSTSGLATTSVVPATTTEDLSGPAGTTGRVFSPDPDDDTRIVQIGVDESARVIDARTGKLDGAPRPGIAAPADDVLVHNGRMIVLDDTAPRRVLSYDLGTSGEPTVLYTAPADTGLENLTPCGAERVCWTETTGYEDEAAQVAGVDFDEAARLWHRGVPGVDALVPVGDSVLATAGTSPATTSLLDAAGEVTWTRTDETVARLDGGNLLRFSGALSPAVASPAVAGEHVGGEALPLGALRGVRSGTCSWNTSAIACVADGDLVLYRFTG